MHVPLADRFAARRYVPDPQHAVATPNDDPLAVREGDPAGATVSVNGRNLIRVAIECKDFVARRSIPELQCLVVTARSDPLPIQG